MARQKFDISSKWLLRSQGKGALLVGGLTDVERIEPLPGEIAQTRKYPDGLLQVYLRGDAAPHLCLLEVATRAEKRALKQALNDLSLAYNAFGRLPDLLMLVLSPQGNLRISGTYEVRSNLGLASIRATWKAVELWSLSAEDFLAHGDVGVVPWVPLMRYAGPPEKLLQRCATRIKREARQQDQAEMLAVAEVLGALKFPPELLAKILQGDQTMIESPMFQYWQAEGAQKIILGLLKDRFGPIPKDVTKQLRQLRDEEKLGRLSVLATKCPDVNAFREALLE